MLDTESPAMESNGDGFLPDLPVVGQTADWSAEQIAPGPLPTIMPGHSDASQDAMGQQQAQDQQMNSTELGSVEKAVEQFQLANAPLFHNEQPQPPPQPTEEAEQPPAHSEMSAEPESAMQCGTQGNNNLCSVLSSRIFIY